MKKIIRHIKNQSEEVRRHILHALTAVATIILLFFWVYSLGTSLGSPEVQAKTSNDLKPFAALKDNLVGGYQSIYESQ